MRTCKKCGRELPEDAVVCPYCNKKEESVFSGIAMKDDDEVDREYQEERKTCSKCGRKLKSDWEKEHGICVYCNIGDNISDTGSNVPEYKISSTREKNMDKNKSESPLFTLIGAILLIIVLAMIIEPGSKSSNSNSSVNNSSNSQSKESSSTEFEPDLYDQLLAIGISDQYASSDKSIFERCGINHITGAKKQTDVNSINVYTSKSGENRNITIMVKNGTLFYLGIDGNDLYTIESGCVQTVDNISAPSSISSEVKSYLINASKSYIQQIVKYPSTLYFYESHWEFDKIDDFYFGYGYYTYNDALGNVKNDAIYMEILKTGTKEYTVNRAMTLENMISDAYSLFGEKYGEAAEKYLSTVYNAYSEKERGIFLYRELMIGKSLIYQGVSQVNSYAAAKSLTQMCYTFSKDIGFTSQNIFERLMKAVDYNDYSALYVIGKPVSESDLSDYAKSLGIVADLDKMTPEEKALLLATALLK